MSSPPFVKSTFLFPCYCIKMFVSCQGTGYQWFDCIYTQWNEVYFQAPLKISICLWGVLFIVKKPATLHSYIFYNKKLYHAVKLYRTHNTLLPIPEIWWDFDILLFIHFYQITLHPCLDVILYQDEFLFTKILWHPSLILHVHLAGV
jgi:hypothetical protein